jgi:hypothetical protein
MAPLRAQLRFCPRCGLPNAGAAFLDASPLGVLTDDGHRVRVLERIDYGSISSVYRCLIPGQGAGAAEVEGIFKIARDARTNDFIANEAAILRRLHTAPDAARFTPFIPALVATARIADTEDPRGLMRQANVLRTDSQIRSPADELYTLRQVRGCYRAGLDARDMAWIWRRLLMVLGFTHAPGIVHGAVLPMHVLIEPREHKLVLIDSCCAMFEPARSRRPLVIITGGFESWYDTGVRRGLSPSPALDISMGARCMVELSGGDPVSGRFPPGVDPALQRYFDRCLACTSEGPGTTDAWQLLADFDRLIEVLWGPRRFRVLELPPMRH